MENTNIQLHVVIDSFTYIGDSVIGESSCIGSHVATLNLLPDEKTPPRLREHLATPRSLKKLPRRLRATVGYGARIALAQLYTLNQ